MTIIVPPGLERLARVDKPKLQKAAVQTLTTAVSSGAAGTARGRMAGLGGTQRKAAGSITYRKLSDGFSLGGVGTLLPGSEYGGRRRPKQTYVIHRRNARPYTVRRRTTMQFLPHAGRAGYAITPTLRSTMAGIRQKITKAVMAVAGGR